MACLDRMPRIFVQVQNTIYAVNNITDDYKGK
jgi:hypothetical protein